MLKTVWIYWLGVWLIGPFDTYAICNQARQYQLENGGEVQDQVSVCYRWEDAGWRGGPGGAGWED